MNLVIRDKNKGLGAEIRALRLFSPVNRITAIRQNLDFQRASLVKAMERQLREMQTSRSLLERRLNDLSPLSVLKRGYSITLKLPEKQVLKDVSGMGKGDQVQVLLGEGELECRVQKVKG
jgi:exodeoxyribonuclease VII large subunit